MKRTVKILRYGVLVVCAALAPSTMAENAKVAICAGCHGVDGMSPNSKQYPNLAGQSVEYLVKSISDYKPGGARVDPAMQVMVGTLSDQDITELAEYFAGQALK